ncbi:MAG TPA: hypothetical protein VGB73_01810 [Pyrinomonadaceae bacterium]|jgi:hypothetical protein
MKNSKQPDSHQRTTRRRFTTSVAAALVAAPLAAATRRGDNASAQTPPAAKQAPAPPNPEPSPTPSAQQPPSPLAEAYTEVARQRFGDKLTPAEMERVKRDLEGNVRTSERLRASKLTNADEPDFTFIA